MLKIKNIEKSSLVDYPPYICATIFIEGCDFKCGWCYNPSLVNLNNPNLDSIPEYELLNWLKTRIGKLDSVCITGGNPIIHGHELTALIHPIKEMGYKVKLDTNGTNPKTLNFLIKNKMVDFIAMDIKGDLENYGKFIGIQDYNTSEVKESIEIIKSSGIEHEFRMTVVPTLHTPKNIETAVKYVGKENFTLQNFKPLNTLDPKYEKITPFSDSELKKIADNLGIKSR